MKISDNERKKREREKGREREGERKYRYNCDNAKSSMRKMKITRAD